MSHATNQNPLWSVCHNNIPVSIFTLVYKPGNYDDGKTRLAYALSFSSSVYALKLKCKASLLIITKYSYNVPINNESTRRLALKLLTPLRWGSNPMRGNCQLLTEGCWFTPRNNVFLQLWKLTTIHNQRWLKNGVKHQFTSPQWSVCHNTLLVITCYVYACTSSSRSFVYHTSFSTYNWPKCIGYGDWWGPFVTFSGNPITKIRNHAKRRVVADIVTRYHVDAKRKPEMYCDFVLHFRP